MRARIFAPGGVVLAVVELDDTQLARPLGPADHVVLVLDEPQGRPTERRALMLEGRLETVR
jgi:hypothetical protein